MFILLTFSVIIVFITFFHVRAHRPTHPLALERREAWEKSICDRPLRQTKIFCRRSLGAFDNLSQVKLLMLQIFFNYIYIFVLVLLNFLCYCFLDQEKVLYIYMF